MDEQWPAGPFRRRDLETLGISPKRLEYAVRDGRVRRVVRGVFADAELADSTELRAAAVALTLPPHHVVADRSAAWLWGVNAYGYAEGAAPAVEMCALRHHEPTGLAGVDGRTRDLSPADVTTLHGVRVTTPLRTALDLGCHLRRREAYAVLNELARLHGLTRADYERTAVRFRRRRGVVQLRQLVACVEPRVESPRESWLLLAILDEGLPVPEPQVWVGDWRLDFAYVRQRVAVEYDGREFHELTDEQRRHDERRRQLLADEGWTVIVVRQGDFSGDAYYRWVSRLRDALAPSYSSRRW